MQLTQQEISLIRRSISINPEYLLTMTTNIPFVDEVLAVAKMFPDIDPALIENSGEQRFYEAAATFPDAAGLQKAE